MNYKTSDKDKAQTVFLFLTKIKTSKKKNNYTSVNVCFFNLGGQPINNS